MNRVVSIVLEYSIYLIPFLLLTGPALPDIALSLSGLAFLYLTLSSKDFKYFNNFFVIFFLLWWVYITINSTFSKHPLNSYESSLFYFRYIFFALAIFYLLEKFPNFLKNLFYIFSFIYFFLVIDAFIQLYFGYDIFLIEKRGENRISAIFGDESILGSYLVRFLPFYLFLFFYLKINKFKYLFYLLIMLIYLGIFLSGERTSIAMLIIFNLLMIIFIKGFSLEKIFLIIIPIVLLSSILIYSEQHAKRLLNFSFVEVQSLFINKIESFNPSNSAAELPSIRLSIYKNAYEVFQSNPLIGVGPKNFRIECKKYQKEFYNIEMGGKIENPILGCSTHPHNNYIQLFAETGIIGTIPIILFFIYICVQIVFSLNSKYRNKNQINNAKLFLYFAFFINFFPFLPSGSFFNNWLNVIYFYPLGAILFLNYKKN